MKFKITWPDGQAEVVEQSDCSTVDQYINCRFGSQGAGEATVELDAPPVEPPAQTTVTAKAKK